MGRENDVRRLEHVCFDFHTLLILSMVPSSSKDLYFPILTGTFVAVSQSVLFGGRDGLDRYVVPHH